MTAYYLEKQYGIIQFKKRNTKLDKSFNQKFSKLTDHLKSEKIDKKFVKKFVNDVGELYVMESKAKERALDVMNDVINKSITFARKYDKEISQKNVELKNLKLQYQILENDFKNMKKNYELKIVEFQKEIEEMESKVYYSNKLTMISQKHVTQVGELSDTGSDDDDDDDDELQKRVTLLNEPKKEEKK